MFETLAKTTPIYVHGFRKAFVSKEMKEYFESVDIKYFFTLGHAPVAERQIRTVKDLLYRRIENNGGDWVDFIFQVLQTYNYKMVHTVSKFTPAEAMKPGNLAQVKFNLELRAKKQRTYPQSKWVTTLKSFTKKTNWTKKDIQIGCQTKRRLNT